jgi:hypothetical protein
VPNRTEGAGVGNSPMNAGLPLDCDGKTGSIAVTIDLSSSRADLSSVRTEPNATGGRESTWSRDGPRSGARARPGERV